MCPKDRKYFRFHFSVVLALAFLPLISPTTEVSMPISPTAQVSVPKGCIAVAAYVAKIDWSKPIVLDVKLVNNFIGCIQGLYKIYKETDWKAVRKLLPKEVQDLVLKVQNMGESTTAIVKKGGPGFVSAYLFYKSLDMYDRAMNLAIDYKMYREEFELLQIELRSVTEFIDKELMPLWEHLDSATLHTTRARLIEKLSRFHAVLVKLARVVDKDLKTGENGRKWAAVYVVATTVVCVVSIFLGNVPGGVACAGTALSGLSFVFLSKTINKLTPLLSEMEIMASEIEEYRILLEEKPILLDPGMNAFLVLLVFVCYLYYRIAQERDQ